MLKRFWINMCGIVGVVGLGDRNLIKKMTHVINYRGPDDEGYYVDKDVSLGHKRLSILDLSEKGKQPMHDERATLEIIYNGEIYNYKELRRELANKYKFNSDTDTEVIIYAYLEYGEKCLEKLRGMFAFAIWDRKNKKLFMARDRLGIKPLYYTVANGLFLFASEIKSILQYENVKRQVDLVALNNYISLRFVNGPRTMFNGINKLQPGHYLVYENNKVRIIKYWNFKFESLNFSENYYTNELLKLMEESVKLRLISDVPLGAYISGGIDSGAVTYFMSKLMNEPVKTFSVGFGLEEQQDELNYAKIIADYFKTDHKELIVKPNAAKTLPEVVWHFDEPVADPAAIPTYLLSKLAKEKVSVVLTGEGGDELFAGYEQYKFIKLGKKLKYVPLGLRSFMSKVASKMPNEVLNKLFKYSSSLGEKGKERMNKFLMDLDNNVESYLDIVSIFTNEERKQLIKSYSDLDVDFSSLYPKKDWLGGLLQFETKVELPDNLLMKVDKMTMAYAVEARVPFLDHKMVEFAATIPSKLKLKGMEEKYILKRAMKGKLPDEIVKRKKQRFYVPIDVWFTKDLKEMALNLLKEGSIVKEGYFNYDYIKNILTNYKTSRLYYARQLWNILNFEIWHKLYIERRLAFKFSNT